MTTSWIPPFHQKFTRFKWQGCIFEFACLAFGLAPAPRIFTKFLKVVMALVKEKGGKAGNLFR